MLIINLPQAYASAWMVPAREVGIPTGWVVTCSLFFGVEHKGLNRVSQSVGVMDDFGNYVEVQP